MSSELNSYPWDYVSSDRQRLASQLTPAFNGPTFLRGDVSRGLPDSINLFGGMTLIPGVEALSNNLISRTVVDVLNHLGIRHSYYQSYIVATAMTTCAVVTGYVAVEIGRRQHRNDMAYSNRDAYMHSEGLDR